MSTKYDYLIVGAGLYGSLFAYFAKQSGKRCLIIDKRNHTGGNIYCEIVNGINVHKYGAHIFHTSNEEVWKFINQHVTFNNYINSPLAVYKDKLYNLPYNMNTFYQLWGVKKPQEAKAIIEKQRVESGIKDPKNLEEQAISLVGKDVYEILIKGYTEKQWGLPAVQIPSFIIKRIPVRFTYNNNYFNDIYQGIPHGGYNQLIDSLLKRVEVKLNTDFFQNKSELESIADKILFTGRIDQFYDFRFGILEYRSLHFEHKMLEIDNFQGNAVVNYTDYDIPYTRIIEHKHFEFGQQPNTVITYEYPKKWETGMESYYPINSSQNDELYKKYFELSKHESKVTFGGRLGEYKYYDMDKIIEQVLKIKDSI